MLYINYYVVCHIICCMSIIIVCQLSISFTLSCLNFGPQYVIFSLSYARSHRQKNTLYPPKVREFLAAYRFMLCLPRPPIIGEAENKSEASRNCLRKVCLLWGKGYFAAVCAIGTQLCF